MVREEQVFKVTATKHIQYECAVWNLYSERNVNLTDFKISCRGPKHLKRRKELGDPLYPSVPNAWLLNEPCEILSDWRTEVLRPDKQ